MKQDSVPFDHRKIVNIYIVYEINKSIKIKDFPILEKCLLGADSLTKNVDIDKYKYSGYGYGIGFNRQRSFSFPGIGLGKKIIIFCVDMSSSTKIDNRKKDILLLGKDPTQR